MKFSKPSFYKFLCLGTIVTGLSLTRTSCAQDKPSILIDSIHAHNSFRLETGGNPFSYHYVYGFRRAFDYLRDRGVEVDEVTQGKLDEKALRGRKLLFINLVSADLPPFRVDEIIAIKSFIENGGSLFVITDHSNCYFHAYKLMPLFDELGIEVTTETACDKAPFTLGTGNGWIKISNFSPHPVTQGLSAIAIQTGGTVDDRFGIAQTSPQGWGDEWATSPYGDEGSAGNYGNWKKDPAERTGPLNVLLAKEVGKGRVFIAADQNMFGDPFLTYADNYKLWLNATSWLLQKEDLKDFQQFHTWRKQRILAYENYARPAFGADDRNGYFNVFGDLGRKHWIFASDDCSDAADLILFSNDEQHLSDVNLTHLVNHLKAGKNVIVLGKTNTPRKGETPLLDQLKEKLGTPDLAAEAGAEQLSWQGTGQIIVMGDAQQFSNRRIPPPEREPEGDQVKLLDGLEQLIEAALQKN